MSIVERGKGQPLVLVPGLQGCWEYLEPTIEALAGWFRVVTFPLCGERASQLKFDVARGLDNYTDQIRAALDDREIERAIVCGISFGGIAALRFAAEHPARTSGLVLVSTPGPIWHLRARHRVYARAPWLFAPVFVAETPFRLRRELQTTFPDRRARWRFAAAQIRSLAAARLSLPRMAQRARLITMMNLADDCARVSVPTLIVTGETALDRVVPVAGTLEYERRIAGARAVVLAGTGHLGSVTKPGEFARVVRTFSRGIRNAAA